MQITAIFLLTLNIWAGFFCCCREDRCENQKSSCSVSEPSEPNASSHCQKSEARDQRAASAEQARASHPKMVKVMKACACEDHASARHDYPLPRAETKSFTKYLVVVLASWFATKPDAESVFSSPRVSPVFLVSARHAPRLSVLGRFLI